MNRRAFLVTAASLAALPARILDSHVHFYDPGRPQGVPWPSKENRTLYRPVLPPECRALTKPLGIRGVIAVEASPWLEDNQWLLDLTGRDPFVRGVVGHLTPGTKDFPGELDRFRRNSRFLGIRLGGARLAEGLRKPAFLNDLQRLAEAGLELDILGGPAPYSWAARLSDRVPELRLVLHHLPNEAAADAAALPEMRGRRRIFAKVSGVLRRVDGRVPTDADCYREGLDTLWSHFGDDRLLYASNWPVSDLIAPYSDVLHVVQTYVAGKGAVTRDKFFWRNAGVAYGLPA